MKVRYCLINKDNGYYVDDLSFIAEELTYSLFWEDAIQFDTILGAKCFKEYIENVFGEKIASRLAIEEIVL